METMYNQAERPDIQEYSFSESQTYDATICIMTEITAMMSGKWKPIILHLIKNDINRFGSLQRYMPKISKKVLTNQLRELCEDDLVTREVVEKKHPQIVVYHLTQKGRSLRLLIDEMINWGLANLSVGSAIAKSGDKLVPVTLHAQ